MKFVIDHIHPKHIIKHPHKWFLAFLISPIHFMEITYKKKYHLNYAHAKKLFIFDTTLILATLAIFGATIFWFSYDPTITSLVYLDIKSTESRVASGDYVEYKISYKNNSPTALNSPILDFNLPVGFVLTEAQPQDKFTDGHFIFDNIAPNSEGGALIAGWIYGTPNQEEFITAKLSYKQEAHKRLEEKSTSLIKVLRGSILETTIESRQIALHTDSIPVSLTIKNTGERTLENVTLNAIEETFYNLKPTDETWGLQNILPDQSVTLKGILNINLAETSALNNFNLTLTPSIIINGIPIDQSTINHTITLAKPMATLEPSWSNGLEKIQPGKIANFNLKITNTGNVNLENLKIELPVPADIIDSNNLANLNAGTYSNETFTKNIGKLATKETKNFDLKIPIKYFPNGTTDLLLSLSPRLVGNVENIPTKPYQTQTISNNLKIGTQLLLNTQIRYYTDEGDQLGRGPLPPKIGEETKYWVLTTITNGTSRVNNPNLTIKLSDYVGWTGKTSLTKGDSLSYDAGNSLVTWQTNNLEPHEKVGVYFEISLIPTPDQIGKNPILVSNIDLTGHDNFISENLIKNMQDLDTSLPDDSRASKKGIVTQ